MENSIQRCLIVLLKNLWWYKSQARKRQLISGKTRKLCKIGNGIVLYVWVGSEGQSCDKNNVNTEHSLKMWYHWTVRLQAGKVMAG